MASVRVTMRDGKEHIYNGESASVMSGTVTIKSGEDITYIYLGSDVLSVEISQKAQFQKRP